MMTLEQQRDSCQENVECVLFNRSSKVQSKVQGTLKSGAPAGTVRLEAQVVWCRQALANSIELDATQAVLCWSNQPALGT